MAELDEIIHQRTRLSIMSYLAALGEADFLTMRKALNLSDGNISVHTNMLEKAGFIETQKEIVAKKTKTTYKITKKGRSAFQDYIKELESIIRGGLA